MMNNSMYMLEKIIKMNENEQKNFLRSFSRLQLIDKIETMNLHRSLLHKLRQFDKEIPIDILSYAALIMALQIMHNEQEALSKLKISDMSIEEIQHVTSKKAKSFLQKKFRIQTKRERLIRYWGVVKTLKIDEKFSFRQIEAYLKKYYRFEISYSTIAKVWHEIENTRSENYG